MNKKNISGVNQALVCRLGLISFPHAMEFEHRLLSLRHEEKVPDVLLIFEHPPTVTMGKFGDPQNILADDEELERRGIALYSSDRGGDATFNCPAQLVVHPIVNLRLKGARAYIRELEELGIRVLQAYGIKSERSEQHPGLWVNGRQIGAIGLRFSRGISMHGLSINVNPVLASFDVINLCGLPGKTATSIEKELYHPVPLDDVMGEIENVYSDIFQTELTSISKQELSQICFDSPDDAYIEKGDNSELD
jgi:lipoyl(octanoyl) transferase